MEILSCIYFRMNLIQIRTSKTELLPSEQCWSTLLENYLSRREMLAYYTRRENMHFAVINRAWTIHFILCYYCYRINVVVLIVSILADWIPNDTLSCLTFQIRDLTILGRQRLPVQYSIDHWKELSNYNIWII